MTARRSASAMLAVLATTLLAFAGCASRGPVEPALSWPAPPREPFVTYVRSIHGSEVLERSFFARIGDFLFGAPPDMNVQKPWGLSWDGGKRLLVADTARIGIQVLDFGAGRVFFHESLGPHGNLIEPVNVIPGPGGEFYVADTGLQRVVVLDPEGRFVRFLGQGVLERPVGLAFSPDGGMLYVTDAARHCVLVFDAAGELLQTVGERGDQQGQFYHPLGVAVGPAGRIYVVDSFHFAIQVFDPSGGYLFSFGPKADGIGSLARPRALAFDSDDHLYVTDALNNNVQVFSPDGTLLLSFGTSGTMPGQYRLPAGICITADDRIFVADSINNRIQEFRYVRGGNVP